LFGPTGRAQPEPGLYYASRVIAQELRDDPPGSIKDRIKSTSLT
jgi:hypothetical protein